MRPPQAEGDVLDDRGVVGPDRGLHRARGRRAAPAPADDPRASDLVGIARPGVVYTGGVKKIAEHGGASDEDRNVPLVVSGAGVPGGGSSGRPVLTTQVAPTILTLLGLAPHALDAVRREHTRTLPLH